MNINIYKLQTRYSSMHALCGLTWVNVMLAGVLLIQQQTWTMQQAYLIGRTPADRVGTVFDAKEMDKSIRRRVAVEDAEMTTDILIEETESSSSDTSESVIEEPSSVASLRPAAPYIASSSSSSIASSEDTRDNAASASASAASASAISVPHPSAFPAFGNAVMPVAATPNWGAMKTPAEWNRGYGQMDREDFVPVPGYNLKDLTTPVKDLQKTRNDPETVRLITEKLFYSTRYFGAYDIDATEFSAVHPGIDLKLADGTPVGSVAGGRVHDVRREDGSLGLHVIIEHRTVDGETFYSVYGHLDTASVSKGDTVGSGERIGTVGMTGNTSGPHLHLQIDRGEPNEDYHSVYWPSGVPTRQEADKHAINPIEFVRTY